MSTATCFGNNLKAKVLEIHTRMVAHSQLISRDRENLVMAFERLLNKAKER